MESLPAIHESKVESLTARDLLSIFVVHLALVLVRENFIGLAHPLEVLLSLLLVVWVFVLSCLTCKGYLRGAI